MSGKVNMVPNLGGGASPSNFGGGQSRGEAQLKKNPVSVKSKAQLDQQCAMWDQPELILTLSTVWRMCLCNVLFKDRACLKCLVAVDAREYMFLVKKQTLDLNFSYIYVKVHLNLKANRFVKTFLWSSRTLPAP